LSILERAVVSVVDHVKELVMDRFAKPKLAVAINIDIKVKRVVFPIWKRRAWLPFVRHVFTQNDAPHTRSFDQIDGVQVPFG
jgi:hypothetical protein